MEGRPRVNREKVNHKLEEYGKALANEDVLNYIMLLITKCKRTREQLLKCLREFFEDQTEEFVD